MQHLIRIIRIIFIGIVFPSSVYGQTPPTDVFTYNEFLAFVKKHHPAVKQANLNVTMAQAQLLQSRGAFDPKIEVDYDNKQFKGKEYYNLLNGGLKIPTWFGIELKAAFDRNEGIFLNPENSLPLKGLTTLGISVPIGQDLWINKRMADLKKSKLEVAISQSERKLQATKVIYDASIAYFEWIQAYELYRLYDLYWANAQQRLQGVVTLVKLGDKPAIDSIEAGIVMKKRAFDRDKMQLKLIKSRLNLSNYVWTTDAIPLELGEQLIPETDVYLRLEDLLTQNELLSNEFDFQNHPKIQAYENKIKVLEVDKNWKANQLLPKLNVGYYYLSEPDLITQQDFSNYKVGLNFSYALFLRKERAAYQLSKYKIENTKYDLSLETIELKNKLKYQNAEILTLKRQMNTVTQLVNDFNYMLTSEEHLFQIGESSIFLINSREEKLLKMKIEQIELQNQYCQSNAFLFNIQASIP